MEVTGTGRGRVWKQWDGHGTGSTFVTVLFSSSKLMRCFNELVLYLLRYYSELCEACCCAVADGLLAKGIVTITGRQFVLSPAAHQLHDDQDSNRQCRTVLVKNVPQDMEETLLLCLENKRIGGGDIEATRTDERSRTVTVTFCEQDGMCFLVFAQNDMQR